MNIIKITIPIALLCACAMAQGVQGPNDGVINTNFVITGGDQKKGGEIDTGIISLYTGRGADYRYLNDHKNHKPWDDNIYPKHNEYFNMKTSYTPGPDAAGLLVWKNIIQSKFQEKNRPIFDITVVNDPYQLTNNSPNFQVLNNLVQGNSLFSIIFPPFWNSGKRLPVVVGGLGYGSDNNKNLYDTDNLYSTNPSVPYVDFLMSSSGCTLTNCSGAIFVYSNAGGREALGLHSDAINDVGTFLSTTLLQLGGDPYRIIIKGGSRGGNNALVWGANPGGKPYTIKHISAYYPPVMIGSMSGMQISNFPSLAAVPSRVIGSDAWSDKYKEGPDSTLVSYDTKMLRCMKVLLGISGAGQWRGEANDKSAYGYYKRADLVPFLRSKRIVITQGSHDAFMPLGYFSQFDKMLDTNNIFHKTVIAYGYGHDADDITPPNQQSEFEKSFIKLLNNNPNDPIVPFSYSEKVYFMPGVGAITYAYPKTTKNLGGAVKIDQTLINGTINLHRPGYIKPDQTANQLGFSASFPYKVWGGQKAQIMLIGAKGKSWSFVIRTYKGYDVWLSLSGVFGSNTAIPYTVDKGEDFIVLDIPTPTVPSDFRADWTFKYNGNEIPSRFTTAMEGTSIFAPSVTTVTVNEPASASDYHHPTDKSGLYNFGVDQYHTSTLSPNVAPVFQNFQPTYNLVGGQLLNIQLTATDLDGDIVTYDITDLNGNLVTNLFKDGDLSGPHCDRTLGVFQAQTASVVDPISYSLLAVAKDGKGGVTTSNITVNITP